MEVEPLSLRVNIIELKSEMLKLFFLPEFIEAMLGDDDEGNHLKK